MEKRIVALILFLVCIFSLAACKPKTVDGDYSVVVDKLRESGYSVIDLETPYEYEILSCLHAEADINGQHEELYVIYCANASMANKVYEYVKNKYNHEKSELEMEEKILEYAYKNADINSESKVEHYSHYLEVKEKLKKYDRYSYGRNVNMVWYGTNKAIEDSNSNDNSENT